MEKEKISDLLSVIQMIRVKLCHIQVIQIIKHIFIDFLKTSCPIKVVWESSSSILKTQETPAQITYKAAFPKPIQGWLAFFIQFNFPSVEESVIVVTTEANIIPETYPFEDCTLDGCFGKLV